MVIIKKTLSQQIYEDIKADIISKKISFGDKLVNRDLQEKYCVSSTPVRDAINHLYQDGLVDDITKTGAHIIEFDGKMALETNELLGVICHGSVLLACRRADPYELSSVLYNIIKLQECNTDNSMYDHYDYKFHKAFFDHSENSHFKRLYYQYSVLQEMLVYTFHEHGKTKGVSIAQHKAISNAVAEGNGEKAATLVREHYLYAENTLLKNFK